MKHYDVLLTGASGFVGSYLSNKLIQAGYSILGVDKKTSPTVGMDFILHDLTQPLKLNCTASVCIHLAASVGGIIFNNQNESDIVSYNSKINEVVDKLCDEVMVKELFFFSSINVFESSPTFEHKELELPPKETGYAISKAEGEKFFSKSDRVTAVIRPTNIYGKNQLKSHSAVGESHVIPDLLYKIANDEKLFVMGDGSQRRNFVHVVDVVNFVVGLIGKLSENHYFNLRSENTLTIAQLTNDLLAFSKKECEIIFQPEYMKFEKFQIEEFDMSTPLAHGWRAKFNDIKDGLEF